jgi:hypothetical protein
MIPFWNLLSPLCSHCCIVRSQRAGHGEYNEIGGSGNEKEFFDAAKASARMVCHFYRKGSPICEIMDMHMNKLAKQHTGTRFVKINAETSPFLAER